MPRPRPLVLPPVLPPVLAPRPARRKQKVITAWLIACLGAGLGMAFALTVLTPLPARASAHRAHVQDGKVPAQPLPNFHEVHPYLYRGGQPNHQGVEKLHDMGVKTVIDLRAETAQTRAEKAHLESLGMRYIDLPMSSAAPTEKQVETFLQTVKASESKNQPLFVHCAHGSDRTGCMVGIWRVTQDGYSYDQAYKEMRKYYFGPQFTKLSQAVKKRASK